MDNKEAIQLLAEIQFNQLRKARGCGKLQFTLYGKCMSCKNSEDCQKLDWILGEGKTNVYNGKL